MVFDLMRKRIAEGSCPVCGKKSEDFKYVLDQSIASDKFRICSIHHYQREDDDGRA